jgi:hypothetical protein
MRKLTDVIDNKREWSELALSYIPTNDMGRKILELNKR